MGTLTRAKDWSQTSAGPVDTWPQSLRTTLGIILNSKFPMFLWWGQDLICFYNDAYRPSLGKNGKHPEILGMPAKEAWTEIWDTIKPLIDQVLQGGEATWSEDQLIPIYRNGKIEDVYWTFSYSPVKDEFGKVAGVLVTCTETTEKVRNYARLDKSLNEFHFAIEATELGTWDYDPQTNEFIGNARLKEWFGQADAEKIDLDRALNVVASADRQRVMDAINRALEFDSGGSYDIEYTLIDPHSKKERIVKAKGRALFSNDKRAIRFNGTLQDITETVIARKKIEESEKNLRMMILQAPVSIGIFRGPQHIVEIVNQNALQLWGRREEEVINRPILEAMPELLEQGIKELLDEVYNTGNTYAANELEVKLYRNNELQTAFINFSYEALRDTEGTINGIMAVGFEVTEQVLSRKKVEQSEQRVRSFVENAPFPIGIYTGKEMKIELTNQAILDVWGKGNDVIGKLYADVLPELENQKIFQQLNDVYTTGQVFHATNQPVKLIVNGKEKLFYFNYTFTPLYDADGKIYGVMNTAADVTDLNITKQKVEESDKRFRDTVKQVPVGITILRGSNFVVEMANSAYLQIIDKTESDFVGKPLFETLPEVREAVDPLLKDVMQTGQPHYGFEFEVPLNRYGRAELTYFDFVYHPLREQDGEVSGVIVVATEVTASVHARNLLAESEKQFRNLVMQSPIPMTIFRGEDFIIEIANKEIVEKIWRKHESEVIGKKVLDVFPELNDQKYPNLLREVFETGKFHREVESVAYVKGNDGMQKFYLDFEYAPLFQTDGTTSGIMITVNDVTEKVEARQKVENAEQRLRLAVEATEIATWDLDLLTDEIVYLPRLLEIFGHDPSGKFTHPQMRDQIHPEDIANVRRAFDLAMESGIYKYEARVVRTDNTICWIRTQGKVFYDKDEKPVKLIGTLRDVTEEKTRQQELEESEQKFRLLANSMPQLIWTGDANGDINYYNQAVYEYSGMTSRQLSVQGWINIVHPDDREENIKAWQHAVQTGKDFLFEHRFRRHDGEYRWQLTRAIPQRDANGNIQMWVGTSTDIQEMKEMDQQKDYFISLASHELKTPITSIKAYTQILQSKYANSNDAFLTKSLNVVDKQILKLTNLISDLLDLSKIKSGTLTLHKENFHINELVREVIDEIRHVSADHEISFLPEKDMRLNADRERISQVLVNLLTNAIKYSPEFGNIVVQTASNDNQLMLSVQDFGIGINKTDQEKIFERFYRVEGKNEKTFPGFGIGLFIAMEIIQRHNGTMGVTSEPGKGSIFYFSIPL